MFGFGLSPVQLPAYTVSGEVKGNSEVAVTVAAGEPTVPNALAVVMPVLKTITESALDGTRLPPTRVVKLTGIDPGWSYWRARVFVLAPMTLVPWGAGTFPSRSTSEDPEGVSV